MPNNTAKEVTVEAIRSIEAVGQPILNLSGTASADRVLSESSSEDCPELHLYDLGKVLSGMHRGAGSPNSCYNRESKQSLFSARSTADRF